MMRFRTAMLSVLLATLSIAEDCSGGMITYESFHVFHHSHSEVHDFLYHGGPPSIVRNEGHNLETPLGFDQYDYDLMLDGALASIDSTIAWYSTPTWGFAAQTATVVTNASDPSHERALAFVRTAFRLNAKIDVGDTLYSLAQDGTGAIVLSQFTPTGVFDQVYRGSDVASTTLAGASSPSPDDPYVRSGSFVRLWSLTPEFVGQTPENPITPHTDLPPTITPEDARDIVKRHNSGFGGDGDDEREIEPVDIPQEVTGGFLTTPFTGPVVSDGLGHTTPAYYDPELAIGYGYTSLGGNRFTSFEVPSALPQGDDTFRLLYGGISYDIVAGERFDLTTLNPLGVDSFLLLGIDASELIGASDSSHPPFVFGATFANPGLAAFSTFALVNSATSAVPEPTSMALFGLGALGLIAGRRRQKSTSSHDAQTDN